jgi:hypothetical protein
MFFDEGNVGLRFNTKSKYNMAQFMTGKFFIIRVEKRRHSLSYVEYFQRRRMENFRSGLGHIIFGLGIR